jgi:hypothetical protein
MTLTQRGHHLADKDSRPLPRQKQSCALETQMCREPEQSHGNGDSRAEYHEHGGKFHRPKCQQAAEKHEASGYVER